MKSLYDDLRRATPNGFLSLGDAQVGIDVESIDEFAGLLNTEPGANLLESRFSPMERDYVSGDPNLIAGRWAVKEAVAKAIGTGFRGLRPLDIEVIRDSSGQPFVRPYKRAVWPSGADNWHWSVSLSRAGDAAIAIAIGIPR